MTDSDLIERLRYEADISDRLGQMDRLNALADEFAAALEAARKDVGVPSAKTLASVVWSDWMTNEQADRLGDALHKWLTAYFALNGRLIVPAGTLGGDMNCGAPMQNTANSK